MPSQTLTNFSTLPKAPWNTFIKGSGELIPAGDALRFFNANTTATQYSNAQIDDYQGLPRGRFLWRPPLRMTVRAQFSHPAGALNGTAGFGFWNDPFMMTGKRWPTLPRAVWFFYASPPSNMKLDLNVPGFGWKATALDALRWPFFALLPLAPLAVPLMNSQALYRAFWPTGQRAIHVSEALVEADMTNRHTYTITWRRSDIQFQIDDEIILKSQMSPRGPLGFVMWLDNQYMVVTPWGNFKYGLLSQPGRQWMAINRLEIESIAS